MKSSTAELRRKVAIKISIEGNLPIEAAESILTRYEVWFVDIVEAVGETDVTELSHLILTMWNDDEDLS